MSTYCPHCKMLSYDIERCDYCRKPINTKPKKRKKSVLEKIINKAVNKLKEKNIKEQNSTIKLTPKEIGEHFGTTGAKINTILLGMKWIEKKGRWITATKEGIKYGAEEKYNAKNKTKYVLWDKRILKNGIIINAIEETRTKKPMSKKEKEEKGKKYEEYVKEIYESKGYTVWEHGKEKGVRDQGIDIIAKKESEIILIQCKNWNEKNKWKINHKDIKVLRTEARDFIEQNPIFKNYTLILRYTLSGNFLHQSAKKYIEETNKNVDYEIIEFKE